MARTLPNDLITALRRSTRVAVDAEELEAVADVVGAFRLMATGRRERRQYDRLLNRVHARMDAREPPALPRRNVVTSLVVVA
ncbi:hypothetical protein [Streptomyces sp. L2]|uniref:hypothetical protein n=1 Tax=Streptomyces sp. L2 TaxID=2162665 RepID=UPI001013692D|nr:hypothetical protein [Streptomyces sp. L2]